MADKEPWKLARIWDKMMHPARPSELNQKVYERFILTAKALNPRAKVMVMGSTPEIRDLIIKHGLVPTVVDISENVYKALTLLMKLKGEENFVHSDWLEMPTNVKHDLVLADTAINMLKWKDFETYLRKIHDVLKEGGYYVERLPVREFIPDKKYLVKYIEEKRKLFGKNLDAILSSLGYPFILYLYNFSNSDEVFLNKIGYILEELLEEKVISEREFEHFKKFVVPLRFCIPPREKLENLIEKYFIIEERIVCNDVTQLYDGWKSFCPIYVMRRK